MRITSCDNSEVFQEYLKIAKASGLIQEIEPTELEKKTKEQDKEQKKGYSTRAEYQEIDTSDLFYGKKPESIYKYKDNIMEAAHEKGPQVAPAYDKQNGIVETNIEQQKIIVDKVNTNYHDHMKNYIKAENDLLKELIKIANVLDLNDNKLVATADKCIEQLNSNSKKKLKKQANPAAPILIGGIALSKWLWGAGILTGLTAYLSNKEPADQGLISNIDYVIKEANDLIEQKFYSPTGQEQGKNIKDLIIQINDELTVLRQLAINYLNVPTTNLDRASKDTLEKYAQTIDAFIKKSVYVSDLLSRASVDIMAQREVYYNQDSASEWYNKVYRSLKKNFFADDYEEVAKGITVLLRSLQKEISKHNQAASAAKQDTPEQSSSEKPKQKKQLNLNSAKINNKLNMMMALLIKAEEMQTDINLTPEQKREATELAKAEVKRQIQSGVRNEKELTRAAQDVVEKYFNKLPDANKTNIYED